MSDSFMTTHIPHAHLSEDALWALAEDDLSAGQESPEALQAKACPLCGPSLQFAKTQLMSLRALPELKTPPDFLAQVRARLEKEEASGHMVWRTLVAMSKNWKAKLAEVFAPALGTRLPAGLAGAALLVLILVWNLPYSPEQGTANQVEAPKPDGSPQNMGVDVAEKTAKDMPEKQKPVVTLSTPPQERRHEPSLDASSGGAMPLARSAKSRAPALSPPSPAPPPSLLSRLSLLGLEWRQDQADSGDSLRFFIQVAQGDQAIRLLDSLGYGGLYRVLRQGDSLRFSLPK